MSQDLVFYSGRPRPAQMPLERYLPPIPRGVAGHWLEEHIPSGGWVLEPFGASPHTLMEIARCGYRVIAALHNPVLSFAVQVLAQAPTSADLNAALAQLGAAKFRDTRLEPHLRALYQTQCQQCGRNIAARAFLWEKDAAAPYGRVYTCPHCQHSGEFPASAEDRQRAAQFANSRLHHARALERVAPLHDPDRALAEEALTVYPGRAVYVLTTLINRLDGLMADAHQRQLMTALILNACDRANTLWPHPTERKRPRQLTIPPRYREHNLWLALEEALQLWASTDEALPLTHWPNLPEGSTGIVLYEGRFRALADELADIPIQAVVSAIPRPNQAFWTLSALWSGWLWGADAAEGFKSVLRRQRYGWRWHTAALHTTFESLSKSLPENTPLYGLISENESGFLAATLNAGQHAPLSLEAIALRTDTHQAQLLWHTGTPATDKKDSQPMQARIHACLQTRGEPAEYLTLMAAGLPGAKSTITESGQSISQAYDALQTRLQEAISYRGGLLHLGDTQNPASGYWWLAEVQPPPLALADQVEMACVRFLLTRPHCTFAGLDAALCQAFPGLLTPSAALIQCCLESYAEYDSKEQRWSLRPQDQPVTRKQELTEMADTLKTVGQSLGCEFENFDEELRGYQWRCEQEVLYRFYLTVSALLGKIIHAESAPRPGVIVIPGGRANLVTFKLATNPVLAQTFDEHGWQFLKYRHLRLLKTNPALTRQNLAEQLALDPLTYSEPQIRLF